MLYYCVETELELASAAISVNAYMARNRANAEHKEMAAAALRHIALMHRMALAEIGQNEQVPAKPVKIPDWAQVWREDCRSRALAAWKEANVAVPPCFTDSDIEQK